MRESNIKVPSRHRCPKSPRPGCVDSVSCLVVPSHEAMDSNVRATKQPYNACYTSSDGQHHAHVDVHVNVALSKLIFQ